MTERTGKKARGVPAKRVSARRRRNKPKSYGDAEPTTGVAAAGDARPPLGIENPFPEIQGLWDAIQDSAEARFYSDADWQRVRLELRYGNYVLRELAVGYAVGCDEDGQVVVGNKINAQAWQKFQDALTELLVSPAAKRRAGIELRPASDADAVAADAKVLELASKLQA